MLPHFPLVVYLSVWLVVAYGAWAAFVPGSISSTTWLGLNIGTLAAMRIGATLWKRRGPPQSVAQILYDVEHSGGRGR